MFVFCPEYTEQSNLSPLFLTKLNSICQRDYGQSYFADSLICLDLDNYETAQAGDNDATMDAAMGIAEWQNNHTTRESHLLIELRFDYKSTRNFDLRNMKRKVAHSKDILYPESIHHQEVFLYESNIAPQAINYFSRLSRQDKEIKSWLAMDINGFNNFVFDRSSLPYKPKNNIRDIASDLNRKFANGGLVEVDKLVQYWIGQMETYILRYNNQEADAIARVLLSFLQTQLSFNGSFEEEYIALRIEEVKSFINE